MNIFKKKIGIFYLKLKAKLNWRFTDLTHFIIAAAMFAMMSFVFWVVAFKLAGVLLMSWLWVPWTVFKILVLWFVTNLGSRS